MALIICPECGQQVSDKASACVHCGCPLPHQETFVDVYYNGFENFNLQCKYQVNLINVLRRLNDNTLGLADAKSVIDNPPHIFVDAITKENADWVCRLLTEHHCLFEVKNSNSTTPSKYNNKVKQYVQNGGSTTICPKCGSNSIATGARGASFTRGLIGASKTVNRCAKCGYKWEPMR